MSGRTGKHTRLRCTEREGEMMRQEGQRGKARGSAGGTEKKAKSLAKRTEEECSGEGAGMTERKGEVERQERGEGEEKDLGPTEGGLAGKGCRAEGQKTAPGGPSTESRLDPAGRIVLLKQELVPPAGQAALPVGLQRDGGPAAAQEGPSAARHAVQCLAHEHAPVPPAAGVAGCANVSKKNVRRQK